MKVQASWINLNFYVHILPGTGDFQEFLDSGRWTLDAGLWTLDSRRWTMDIGLWTLDSGFWTPDAKLWTLDGSSFNITQKLRTILLLLLFSQCLCQKLYAKTTFFNQICKAYVICTILQTFRIWIFTVLKSRPFQCNGKFESKTSFIVVLTWLLSKILCKNYLFLYKFSTFILRCTI